MQILVVPQRRKDVPVERLLPYAKAEIQAVWDLYAQGICHEFYARADQAGAAVLKVEASRIEAAKDALATLPLVHMNLIDLELIPLAPFTHLTRLFPSES
ncbi:MAG TPA: hypothetical protein VF120_00905 [Ktedonobacterales bacterium]